MGWRRLGHFISAAALMAVGILGVGLGSAHAQQPKLEVSRDLTVTIPQNWVRSEAKFRNAVQLIVPSPEPQKKGPQALTTITTEHRRNHEEAVQRLGEIAVEIQAPPEFIEIGGWPAVQRQYTAPLERIGSEQTGKEQLAPREMSLRTTTAIALADTVVRFDTTLAPGADPKLAESAKIMVRSAIVARKPLPAQTERDLRYLRRLPLPSLARYRPEPSAERKHLRPAGCNGSL